MGNSFLCPVQTDVDWLRLAPQSLSFDSRFDIDEELRGALHDNVLGTGKFSTVYMCTYRDNPDHRYALKAISTYTGDKASYSRIEEEIAIMKAINQHASIIRLIDMDESTPNTIRLVLELCEGGELYDRIQQKRFYSEADTKLLVKNLLEAVEFIHSKGIMHRDLKPENILLVSKVSNTDIKVSDFGLAKLSRDFPRRLPRSTSICGSDFYLAPEVIKQEEYGREIDIWAVGVITFVVLSGALPFFNPVLHKLYRQIVERDVSFADDRWRAVMPHEHLKAKGLVVEFHLVRPGVARRFTPNVISITPLAYGRDDRGVSSEKEGFRHSAVPTGSPAHLYLWYDYFSCPQLEQVISPTMPAAGPSSPLSNAIDSIPIYIARCKFLFALCPVVESSRKDQVFSPFPGVAWLIDNQATVRRLSRGIALLSGVSLPYLCCRAFAVRRTRARIVIAILSATASTGALKSSSL
eukprot:s6010_g3.t1